MRKVRAVVATAVLAGSLGLVATNAQAWWGNGWGGGPWYGGGPWGSPWGYGGYPGYWGGPWGGGPWGWGGYPGQWGGPWGAYGYPYAAPATQPSTEKAK